MTPVTSVDNPANAQRLPETTVASHLAEVEGVQLTEQQRQEMIAGFVDQFHVDLYRFTYRLTADSNWSEDIVQNTFLRAFERLEQLKDHKKARSWLMAIARTTFLGELRKRKSWVFTDAEMNEAEVATVPSCSALDSTNLQQALMEMSEQFRIVLVMHYLEEQSYREISEQLKIPMGTVMSRLSRAKRMLKSKMIALKKQSSQ